MKEREIYSINSDHGIIIIINDIILNTGFNL